jgi:hypothetical protein
MSLGVEVLRVGVSIAGKRENSVEMAPPLVLLFQISYQFIVLFH